MAETMGNSFLAEEPKIQMKPKGSRTPQPIADPAPEQAVIPGVVFPPKKVKRKAYNVYIEVALMDEIEKIAERQGIAKSAALEACLKKVLGRAGKIDEDERTQK